MPDVAYVNGRFCEPSDAVISIEDRGFQFADGVYEVVVAYRGRPFRLDQHFERLKRSLAGIDLPVDFDQLGLAKIVRQGIERCEFDPALAYLQITRGVQARSLVYQADIDPTVVATFKAKPEIDASQRESGVSVVTVEDFRWTRCQIKSISLLHAELAKNSALRDGFDDAIFISHDGEVREATAANVFIVRDGVLMTPPADSSVLQGVTRDYVIECATRSDISIRQETLTLADLESADEVFLINSVRGWIPAHLQTATETLVAEPA